MTLSTTTNQQNSDDILDIENEFKEIIDRSPCDEKQPWDKHFDMSLMWSFFSVNKQLNQALKQADEEIVQQLELMDKQDRLNACQKDINKAFVLLKHASLAKKHSIEELLHVTAKHETLALGLLLNNGLFCEGIHPFLLFRCLTILCEQDSVVEMILNDPWSLKQDTPFGPNILVLGRMNPKIAKIILADNELRTMLDKSDIVCLCSAHLEIAQMILANKEWRDWLDDFNIFNICLAQPEVITLLDDFTIDKINVYGVPGLGLGRAPHVNQFILDHPGYKEINSLGFFERFTSALRGLSVAPETSDDQDAENSTLKPYNKKLRLN